MATRASIVRIDEAFPGGTADDETVVPPRAPTYRTGRTSTCCPVRVRAWATRSVISSVAPCSLARATRTNISIASCASVAPLDRGITGSKVPPGSRALLCGPRLSALVGPPPSLHPLKHESESRQRNPLVTAGPRGDQEEPRQAGCPHAPPAAFTGTGARPTDTENQARVGSGTHHRVLLPERLRRRR